MRACVQRLCRLFGRSSTDPDLDHAAELMREVMADPEAARRRGEAARRHIAAEFSTEALARAAGARLEEIWAQRDAKRARRRARAKARTSSSGNGAATAACARGWGSTALTVGTATKSSAAAATNRSAAT